MKDGRLCTVGDIVKATQFAGPLANESNFHKPVYDYPRPAMTTDMVVFRNTSNGIQVLLIERGGEPFKGMLALPGGYVNIDETCEDAAIRELREETGAVITKDKVRVVGLFDAVDRNPAGRVMNMAYWCEYDGKVKAGDDAVNIGWYSVDRILGDTLKLAFDHSEIVKAAHDCYSRHVLLNTIQKAIEGFK